MRNTKKSFRFPYLFDQYEEVVMIMGNNGYCVFCLTGGAYAAFSRRPHQLQSDYSKAVITILHRSSNLSVSTQSSIYNESARMKAQGQDDLRFEGLTKDSYDF
ncbi:hypothetical protein Tco_1481027 [Tanacetum coccineum]